MAHLSPRERTRAPLGPPAPRAARRAPPGRSTGPGVYDADGVLGSLGTDHRPAHAGRRRSPTCSSTRSSRAPELRRRSTRTRGAPCARSWAPRSSWPSTRARRRRCGPAATSMKRLAQVLASTEVRSTIALAGGAPAGTIRGVEGLLGVHLRPRRTDAHAPRRGAARRRAGVARGRLEGQAHGPRSGDGRPARRRAALRKAGPLGAGARAGRAGRGGAGRGGGPRTHRLRRRDVGRHRRASPRSPSA